MDEGSLSSSNTDVSPLAGPRFRELVATVLRSEKPVRFTAFGQSMYPSIQHGDVVTLSPLRRQIRRDDVIAVICNQVTGKVIVHRVVQLTKDAVETRGDALLAADGWFARIAVLGVVTRVERQGCDVNWYCAFWTRISPTVRRCRLVAGRLRRAMYRVGAKITKRNTP